MGIRGAIIGDIAGSRFEGAPAPTEIFSLETIKAGKVTDDTVMSVGTMLGYHHGRNYRKWYRKIGRFYPYAGYGGQFRIWLGTNTKNPYGSYGNGSAMRIAYIGQAMKDEPLSNVRSEARKSANVSHSHHEGVKGAVAVATAVWLAENGHTKQEIREYIRQEYPSNEYPCGLDNSYPINRLSEHFDASCQTTVPFAVRCFLETSSFMEMMSLINSIGNCDTDTIGAIAGSIAESFYGSCTGSVESDKAIIREIVSNKETESMFDETGKTLPTEIKLFRSKNLPKGNIIPKKTLFSRWNRRYALINVLEKYKII